MFGGILDSIPVVGQVKDALLAVDTSTNEATRETAVKVGGAVGQLGGSVGVAVGATVAGFATDTLTSLVTQKPQGYISCVNDIATDISKGNVPIQSVVRAGSIASSDIACGLSGTTQKEASS